MDRRPASDRPLRVGLNLLFLGPRAGGVGRYARELAGALLAAEPATELTVFVTRDCPADVREDAWAPQARWVTVPVTAGPMAALAAQVALPALAVIHRLDVLHSPANVGPGLTPGVAAVVTLHDLIWLHRPDEWDSSPRAQRAMLRQVRHTVRHADRVFATSRAAADDVSRSLGVAPEQLFLTPMGVQPATGERTPETELRERLALQDARVLLCVAQKRPYKNHAVLVRALTGLPEEVVLVAPGASTPYEGELDDLARELGVSQRVRFPDWLSEADLTGLYAISEVFALPSRMEGFGLPVLEAMAHGVPVVCADIPALREVAGDAALRFDPDDQPAAQACLAHLFADATQRAELIRRGTEQVQRFTWGRTGETSLAGYREAIAGRRERRPRGTERRKHRGAKPS